MHRNPNNRLFMCFNPRSRTGSDSFTNLRPTPSICFNPRSRTGSDKFIFHDFSEHIELQSTLPHGERLYELRQTLADSRLQSTLPHGERLYPILKSILAVVLQSTLPHGERRLRVENPAPGATASIHAPARGAT